MALLALAVLLSAPLPVLPAPHARQADPERPARERRDAGPSAEDLGRDARASDSRTRRAALRKLARLGTREAWELVLDALVDREGEVADEAQLGLGGCADPYVAAELFGLRGLGARGLGVDEALVRARAAEALGRLATPVDARALKRALAQAEGACARLLCWSVERLAPAGRIAGEREELAAALARLADARGDPGVRGAALLALAKLDARAAEERALAFAGAREPALRCAALLAARAWGEMAALALARPLASDEDAGVRAGAIELLAAIPGRDSALMLVERLEREERARLAWRILAHLQALSGQDHGRDAAAWRAWARERAGAVSTGGHATDAGPAGDTGVALAGLPLTSDRVAFLIDLSGSMWSTEVAGRTRKQIVDLELRRALEALPREARFNVVPYTGTPHPWEPRLVPAQPAQVQRAIEAFERCHRSGRGNVWDAAQVALADPEVDALAILTDGVPTGGPHSVLELLVELLLEQNRFRNVAFDSILVDAPRGSLAGWRRLAAASGGRSIAVDLAALARPAPRSGATRMAAPQAPARSSPPQRVRRARSSDSG